MSLCFLPKKSPLTWGDWERICGLDTRSRALYLLTIMVSILRASCRFCRGASFLFLLWVTLRISFYGAAFAVPCLGLISVFVRLIPFWTVRRWNPSRNRLPLARTFLLSVRKLYFPSLLAVRTCGELAISPLRIEDE